MVCTRHHVTPLIPTFKDQRKKVYAKRLKVVILMFYMHLVSAKDVLIFGSAIDLNLTLDFKFINPIEYVLRYICQQDVEYGLYTE